MIPWMVSFLVGSLIWLEIGLAYFTFQWTPFLLPPLNFISQTNRGQHLTRVLTAQFAANEPNCKLVWFYRKSWFAY